MRALVSSSIARFALVSTIPIVLLGSFLVGQTRTSIERRTASVYGGMAERMFETSSAFIVSPADFKTGAAISADRARTIDLLVGRFAGGGEVRVRVVARDGRVVYSNRPADAGRYVERSGVLSQALAGEVATRFVQANRHRMIEIYLPVRFGQDPTVQGVIVASGVDANLERGINHDVHRMEWTLVLGLLGLWLSLLPIAVSVSRRLRRTAEDNQYLALHDTLTTLPNRNLLADRLGQAIATSARSGERVGLLLIDLDGFKEVNDTLGHGKGDELLQRVAGRLVESVRACDTVARLGGDEFAIVATGVADEAELVDLAGRVTANLSEEIHIDGIEVAVRASIGGSIYPLHADGHESLLRHADIAMYAAKAAQVPFAMYDAAIDSHSPSRLALTAELRRAFDAEGQIVLHYQPVACPMTGEVQAVEGLVRWQHPTRGLLLPADFIPMAEQSGLICLLTPLVLDMAVAQARAWADDGIDVAVSVNLSAADLRSMDLLDEVERVLARHGVAPHRLELEVTETAVLANQDTARLLVEALRRAGVAIALDDFGTGYASLTYLKRLRPGRLKIDRSFVEAMAHESIDGEIVRSLIELAHSLGIGVTAEGIETAEQWGLLGRLGCDLVQGYYLARPLPPAAATAWLRKSTAAMAITPQA